MVKRYYIDLESAQYGGNFKQFELMIEDVDGEFVTHSDYAALIHRAEAAEKERDELAEAVHVAMERLCSHEKKQSISQLVADIAYLKRLSKEHYAERDRMREALERLLREVEWSTVNMPSNAIPDVIEQGKILLLQAVDIARAALNGCVFLGTDPAKEGTEQTVRFDFSKGWCLRKAKEEDFCDVSAGSAALGGGE